MLGLEEEVNRVAVTEAGLMRCLVAGRNSVYLPLVLGAQDTPELFKDRIRMVFAIN
jgi:hypothetical protein